MEHLNIKNNSMLQKQSLQLGRTGSQKMAGVGIRRIWTFDSRIMILPSMLDSFMVFCLYFWSSSLRSVFFLLKLYLIREEVTTRSCPKGPGVHEYIWFSKGWIKRHHFKMRGTTKITRGRRIGPLLLTVYLKPVIILAV